MNINIDYNDINQVIALAESLGAGNVVIKHAMRDNYNICRVSRPDRWNKADVEIIHTT